MAHIAPWRQCCAGGACAARRCWGHAKRQAHLQGKQIVGIYKHGCTNSVELPEAFKKYGGATIGWNSLDKLGRVLSGESIPTEMPSGKSREPIYNIIRVQC